MSKCKHLLAVPIMEDEIDRQHLMLSSVDIIIIILFHKIFKRFLVYLSYHFIVTVNILVRQFILLLNI